MTFDTSINAIREANVYLDDMV